MATALVATAEHDPLRHEGAALVDHLRDLDADARHLPRTGLIHGFLTLDSLSMDAGDVLMRRLGRLLPRVA